MKDLIYLRNLGTFIDIKDRTTTFTSKFQVVFSEPGLEQMYLGRLRKYIKRSLTPDLNRKTLEFSISKSVRKADSDPQNKEYAIQLARVKVEIEACKIKGLILRKLRLLVGETQKIIEDQITDADFRREDEIRYYLDATTE